MNKAFHIFFSGTVQGVGFRFTAKALANKFHIKGWAMNLSDGRVEIVTEGVDEDSASFLNALKEAFKRHITDCQTEDIPASSGFNDFHIK